MSSLMKAGRLKLLLQHWADESDRVAVKLLKTEDLKS